MLLGVFGTVALSVAIAVGLIDVVKAFLPSWFNAKGKTVVAVVLEVTVSWLLAAVSGYSVIQIIFTIVCTVAIAQLLYEYVLKILKSIADYFKFKNTWNRE